MSEWNDREERQADARAEYERIMTTPSPDPMGAFIESGVIGFVFGEMWRRGVLTARDRRLITLSCVGAAGATTPIETHVWAALNSDDLTYAELDEFVLFFATQLGWPKASDLNLHGDDVGLPPGRGTGPGARAPRLRAAGSTPSTTRPAAERGEAAYLAVHGEPSPPAHDRVPGPLPPRLPLRRDLDP